MKIEDIPLLQEIHAKFYAHLEMPDFTKFINTFVVEDAYQVIAGGGIRSLVELSLLTNKDISARTRREALYQALYTSLLGAGNHGYKQLHTFAEGDFWLKQLKLAGFRESVSKTLIIG